MACRLELKYVYAESSEHAKSRQGEQIKSLQVNQIHLVNKEKLAIFLESKGNVLTRDDLITIFKGDGADFDKDSIRVHDPIKDAFVQVSYDYKLSIKPHQNQTIEEIFWLKPTNLSHQKQFDELAHESERNRNEIEALKQKIEIMDNEHRAFREEIKSLLPDPSFQLAQKTNSTIESTKPASSSSPREYPRKSSNKSENSKSMFSPPALPREDRHSSDNTIDLAILYSEPLWKKSGMLAHHLKDPVDFEGECTNIMDTLRAKKKKISVFIETATRQKLVSLVVKKPVILHVICHGAYNENGNEYYLCFETKEAELYELYSGDLADILEDIDFKIQLVFVNACHSEEAARVFLKAGVPCVIAVQLKFQILDALAGAFSREFYDQLFDGKSIKDAFTIAKTSVKSDDWQICCCAHSHKKGCHWHEEHYSKNPQKAHDDFHVFSSCGCPKKNEYLHDSSCVITFGHLDELNITDRNPDDKGRVSLCCCCPEIPHNETLKFMLLSNNSNDEQAVLFQDKPPGKVTNNNHFSTVEQNLAKRISGRNFELFKLHGYITDENQRFIHVYGGSGVGKRTLVNQIARYLYERRYFTDKIASLKLEKATTIEDFYACLFKQFPDFASIDRLCDSIKKKSKILLILENCDSVINSCKQDFQEMLRKFITTTKFVKFVIITKSRCELGMNEQKMEIKYLSPRDAAKIFLTLTYEKLQPTERIIDELCEKQLFKEAKLTPPMIWCMSKNFKHRESVNSFGFKYLEERKLAEETESNPNSEIKIALDNIKKDSPDCYQLLLFLGLFPAGLSTYDMEQLSKEGMISENWKVLIKRLIENKKSEQASTDQKETSDQPKEDAQELLPGNYAWINITTETNQKENFHYKVAEFLNEFITSELRPETMKQSLQRLEYMTLLALSIIKYLKEISYCQESIIEYSLIADHGIWKINDKNTYFNKWIKPRNAYTYIDEHKSESQKSLGVPEIRKILDTQSDNFKCCLDPEIVTQIMQVSRNREEIVDVLEIACLAIPTVYKVFAKSTSEPKAKNLCLKGLVISNDEENQNSRLFLLRAKLHLFLISLGLDLRKEKRVPSDDIHPQLQCLNLQIQKADGELYKILSYYGSFADAYVSNKGIRPQNKILSDQKKKPEKTLMLFKKTYDIVSELGPDFQAERCKTAIMVCKLTLKQTNKNMGIDLEIQDQIKLAIKLFRKGPEQLQGQEQLQIYARCQYAGLLLHQMKYDACRENNSSNKKILEVGKYLTKVKDIYLSSHALPMAKSINNKKLQKKINKLVEVINKEIIREYCNVMLFMEADPVVIETRQKENIEAVLETKPAGYLARIPNSFREDLFESLEKKGSEIYTKFERFTKVNFIEALKEGCRIMHLSYQDTSPEGLIAEDTFGRAETISYSDLQKIFKVRLDSPQLSSNWSPPQNSYNGSDSTVKSLDLLILASKNDVETAHYCSKTLKIPNVVYFEFHEKNSDFTFKSYEDFCEKKFTVVFLGKLIEQHTVREAFNKAVEGMFDSVSEEFFESKDSDEIKDILGTGPVLLALDESERLYGDDKYNLRQGIIQDLSRKRFSTNIPGGNLPFIGRKHDINAVFKLLHSFNIVKIEGDAGVGKTAFALELGRFAQRRDFFPDGVFRFPLKLIESDYTLKDMMLDVFGSQLENSFKSFFKNKKMLLIFDDFDVFYAEGLEFLETIFNTLRECKIKVLLFITSLKSQGFLWNEKQKKEFELRQSQIESKYQPVPRELKPMEDAELAYIAASLEKTGNFKSLNASKIQRYSQEVRFAEGNPKTLINRLKEKKVIVDNFIIEINPKYLKSMAHEEALSKSWSEQTLPLGRERSSGSGLINTSFKLSKMISKDSHHSASHENLLNLKGEGLSRQESFQNLCNIWTDKEDKTLPNQIAVSHLDDLSGFTLEGPSKQESKASNERDKFVLLKEHLNLNFGDAAKKEILGSDENSNLKLVPLLGIGQGRETGPLVVNSHFEEEEKMEPGKAIHQEGNFGFGKEDSFEFSEEKLEYSFHSEEDGYYEEEEEDFYYNVFSEGESIKDEDSDISDSSFVLHTMDDFIMGGGKTGKSKKRKAFGKSKPMSAIQKARRKAEKLHSKERMHGDF